MKIAEHSCFLIKDEGIDEIKELFALLQMGKYQNNEISLLQKGTEFDRKSHAKS